MWQMENYHGDEPELEAELDLDDDYYNDDFDYED